MKTAKAHPIYIIYVYIHIHTLANLFAKCHPPQMKEQREILCLVDLGSCTVLSTCVTELREDIWVNKAILVPKE